MKYIIAITLFVLSILALGAEILIHVVRALAPAPQYTYIHPEQLRGPTPLPPTSEQCRVAGDQQSAGRAQECPDQGATQ